VERDATTRGSISPVKPKPVRAMNKEIYEHMHAPFLCLETNLLGFI
jgi:hypothetical protein